MKKGKYYTIPIWIILLGSLIIQSSCRHKNEPFSVQNLTLDSHFDHDYQDADNFLFLDSLVPELSDIKITTLNAHRVVELARFGRGTIEDISVSPDGKKLAVATWIGVWLYDIDTLNPVRFLPIEDDRLYSTAWSPDGKWLSYSGYKGMIYLNNVISEEKTQYSHRDDGRLVKDSSWTPSGDDKSQVMDLAWSPNGTYLAAVDNYGTVKIREALTGKISHSFQGDSSCVRFLDWSPDSSSLALVGCEARVRVWDMETEEILYWDENTNFGGEGVSWSPDGKQLVSGNGTNGRIQIWDFDKNSIIQSVDGHPDNIRNVVWSPDGTKLASYGILQDAGIRIWNVVNGEQLLFFEREADPNLYFSWKPEDSQLSNWVDGMVWTPDGEKLIFYYYDGTVTILDVISKKVTSVLNKHWEAVYSVAWSPDGTQIAFGSGFGSIFILDPSSGELLNVLAGHRESATDIAWSPDGSCLASVSSDRSARIWEVASGEVRFILGPSDDDYGGVVWSADGTKVAAQKGIWDAATGQLIHGVGGPIFGWSPDGTQVAYFQDYELRFLDITNWLNIPISLTSITPMGDLISFDWSPDSARFAMSDGYGNMKVYHNCWEITTTNFQKDKGPIHSLAWSPDGTMLASVNTGEYGGARLFNENGEIVKKFGESSLRLTEIAWSPDGSMLATAGYDGTLRIWGIPSD